MTANCLFFLYIYTFFYIFVLHNRDLRIETRGRNLDSVDAVRVLHDRTVIYDGSFFQFYLEEGVQLLKNEKFQLNSAGGILSFCIKYNTVWCAGSCPRATFRLNVKYNY